MKNLMIDLETLSVKPNAVILSLAAVWFDRKTHLVAMNVVFDTQQQLNMGRAVDSSVIDFWMNIAMKSPEVAKKWVGQPKVDYDVLLKLATDMETATTIWANSPSFDMIILKSLYSDLSGGVVPNVFRKERDVRTMKDFLGTREISEIDAKYMNLDHDPVNDCYKQIEYIQTIWDKWEAPNNAVPK